MKKDTRRKAVRSIEVLKTLLSPEHERPEDRAAFEQLIAQYYDRFHPDGPLERGLLDDVIYCDWSIRRFQRLQAEGGFLGSEWHTLLASKQGAYRAALKTLREYQANPIPDSPFAESALKVTIH